MKSTCHTPEAEQQLSEGLGIAKICRGLEISESIFHRWRNRYGGMKLASRVRGVRDIPVSRLPGHRTGEGTQHRDVQVIKLEKEKLRRRLRQSTAEHVGGAKPTNGFVVKAGRGTINGVHRLWREEELQRPRACLRSQAKAISRRLQVWSYAPSNGLWLAIERFLPSQQPDHLGFLRQTLARLRPRECSAPSGL